jgi:hypothetical protein
MTHHEDAHQGRRLLTVGMTVLVVSSGMAVASPSATATATATAHIVRRDLGTVTLLCRTDSDPFPAQLACTAVIRTPIR